MPASGLVTLCEGDCSSLPEIENPGTGGFFDFELGLEAVLDQLDITLRTEGSVFLVGPITVDDTLSVSIGDPPAPGTIDLRAAGDLVVRSTEEGIDLVAGTIVSVPGSPLLVVAEPGMAESAPPTVFDIDVTGDVFVSVYGVTLARLEIVAGEAVVAIDGPVVPEPGTAGLLGLGLALLAGRFARSPRRRAD